MCSPIPTNTCFWVSNMHVLRSYDVNEWSAAKSPRDVFNVSLRFSLTLTHEVRHMTHNFHWVIGTKVPWPRQVQHQTWPPCDSVVWQIFLFSPLHWDWCKSNFKWYESEGEKSYCDSWPINPRSGEVWPGWKFVQENFFCASYLQMINKSMKSYTSLVN